LAQVRWRKANIQAQRIFDNGMVLARAAIFCSITMRIGDNYDSDTVEKIYLFAQTGFGRVEIGQQDGAATHWVLSAHNQ